MNAAAKSYIRRALVMMPVIPLLALGVSLFLAAGWGVDPFTSLQVAVSQHTGLTLGLISVIINCLIVGAFVFIDRKLIGAGSVLFALFMGPCINFWAPLLAAALPADPAPWRRVLYLAVATVIMAFGLAYYLSLNLGVQATDMIAVTIGRKTGKTVGFGMVVVNVVLFTAALLLGGPWGVGTLVTTFCVGPAVNLFLPMVGPTARMLGGMAPLSKEKTAP